MAANTYNLDFEQFSYVWGAIDLSTFPGELIVYRSARTAPNLQSKPRFFGSLTTASNYTSRNGPIYRCKISQHTKLVDIRCLKYMLLEVMMKMPDAMINAKEQDLRKIMAVLGLLPHAQQVLTITQNANHTNELKNSDKKARRVPFENQGSRLSWGSYDDIMATFAREYLNGSGIDGYIAPMLPMPNGGLFHSEICLFDPKKSLTSVEVMTAASMNYPVLKLDEVITSVRAATCPVTLKFNSAWPPTLKAIKTYDECVPMDVDGGGSRKQKCAGLIMATNSKRKTFQNNGRK